FFEFIGSEVIPFIETTYRTGKFKVAIGHGETANFINYYLLKEKPIFQAYIALSPELAPKMISYLPERLSKIPTKTFYYLATTHNDTESIKKKAEALNTDIKAIDNKNLLY